MSLTLRILGEFRIDGVDLRQLRSRKARQLLKRLALESGSPVHPDRLVDDLWEAPPSDPAADLSVLVSRARKLVGSDRLVRTDGGYCLRADRVDRDDVVALVLEASHRLSAGDLEAARTRAEAALRLAPDRLLADEPDAPWTVAPRAAVDVQLALARRIAIETAYLTGRLDEAVAHGAAALDVEPYDEVALRWVMRAHQAAGRAGAALAAFAQVQARLREDLGTDPDPETVRLHAAVLAGRPAEPASLRHESGPVLVGREREYAALDDALENSRHRASVVLVSGEPGIGKTELCRAWAARAREQGTMVLSIRMVPGTGIQPLADVIIASDLPDPTDPDLALVRSLFAAAPDDPGASWDLPGQAARAETVRARVYDALARLLGRMAPPQGIAVLIDDLDAADEMVTGWFEHVVRHAAAHGFLLVGLWRGVTTAPVSTTTRLELPPLAEADVATLVGPDQAHALWVRSGGNPLLLSELAAADDGAVPLSLRDMVARRLAEAGVAAPTLRGAAVLGADVDLDLLAGVLQLSPSVVLDHLERGIDLVLLVETAEGLRFRHEILREAIEAETTAARTAWLHAEAASLLADRPGADPFELARHARLGGNPRLVARGLRDAADVARHRFDLTAAEAMLGEALEVEETAETLVRRSRVRMARGDFTGADEDAIGALAAGAGADALELRAWAARNRHDMAAAIRIGRAGADLATDPGKKASCLLAVAFAHRGVGDLRAADRVLEESLELPASSASGIAAWSGVLRTHQGRPLEALAVLEPLLGADFGGLHSFWVEHMLQMTAHALGMVGRASDALSVLDRLSRELERRGSDARYAGMPDAYRSWVLRNLGDGEAVDLAASIIDRAPMLEIEAQARLDLADALLVSGRVDEAVEAFEATAPVLVQPGLSNRWRCEQRSGVLAARLDLAAGDPNGAIAHAGEVMELAERRGDLRYAAVAHLVLARAQALTGQPYDEARLHGDLDRLPTVAALEAWWLAADVAADTGQEHGSAVARAAATRLRDSAGEHRAAFERAAARVLT